MTVAVPQVVALGADAERLFIQVTAIGASAPSTPGGPINVSTNSGLMRWHVAIQNPEEYPISARVVAEAFGTGGPTQAWDASRLMTIPGGGRLVLS